MSGKRTRNKAQDCFTDTCVYIHYGIYFNDYHAEATSYFNALHRKHTSESVLIEINHFKDFTRRFQFQLEDALNRGRRKDVIKFPGSIFRGYSESRWALIERIIAIIKNCNAEQMASEYRAFKRLVWARIDEALSKTKNPLEKQSNDQNFIDSLSYIGDPKDQQIIADAALWASQYSYAIFCTTDRNHVLINEPKLVHDVSVYLHKNCLVFKHVQDM